MNTVYRADSPPLHVAVDCIRSVLKASPRRLAFAGRAGAGKNTVAEIIAGREWPIFNHADKLKEEVLEWLADACLHGLDLESDIAFEHFANFLGISPARIQDDLWDLVGPVYAAFGKLYLAAVRKGYNITPFIMMKPGERIQEKVRFVDFHKSDFREALQLYGSMSKEIAADPFYWVNQTISRATRFSIVLNADTRYIDEVECLKMCGWTVMYLDIDDATQRERRPEMTSSERAHHSEWDLTNTLCDVSIDATRPLSAVLMQIADYLTGVPAQKDIIR